MENSLENLQKTELEMLVEFDRVCKKYKLTYSLSAGTLLGAIRHKGFIPWDDDIDVVMPMKDYLKFCKIAKKELKKEYFWQTYETDYTTDWFGKLRKNNTTCIELANEGKKIHKGVWIDVFPIIGVRNNKEWCNNLYKKANANRILLHKKYGSMFGNDLSFEKKILKLIPLNLIRKFVKFKYRLLFKNYDKYEMCYYLWEQPKIYPRFRSNLYNKTVMVEFENKSFPAIEKWNEYLTARYGDYMTLPPPEDRHGCHTISLFDLNKNYTEY